MMFLQTLATEFLKLKRTKITWIIALLFAFGPPGIGFMMFILMNPDLAQHMGLFTAKAEMTIGRADWTTFLKFMGIIGAVGGIVLGFIQAFVFGREYMQGTAKNMLTLPLHRGLFVGAKLIVAAAWYSIIIVIITAEGFLVGVVFGIPGFSPALIGPYLALTARVLVQTLLLGSLPAWIAVLSRGFLAPLGYTIFTSLVLGQIFVHTGWAVWCPWAIPLLEAGGGGSNAPLPNAGSWVVLVILFIAGAAAAGVTLDRADNTQ
jgi:ABC-type transport system involved in multi-copper enzyme maturation permease subunit